MKRLTINAKINIIFEVYKKFYFFFKVHTKLFVVWTEVNTGDSIFMSFEVARQGRIFLLKIEVSYQSFSIIVELKKKRANITVENLHSDT